MRCSLPLLLACGVHIKTAFSFIPPLPGRRIDPSHVARGSLHPQPPKSLHSRGMRMSSSVRAEVVDDVSDDRPAWRKVGSTDVAFPPEFREPKGFVHFVGGAVVGAFPKSAYGPLIEAIAKEGYCVVATPIPISLFDHEKIAMDAADMFTSTSATLKDIYGARVVDNAPIFGMGHSLGAKVHVLLSSRGLLPKRKANILISFNNFSAKESVPLLTELRNLGSSFAGLKGLDISSQLSELGKLIGMLENFGISMSMKTTGWGSVAQQGLSMALDLLSGAAAIPFEFTPTPSETWELLRSLYTVDRNLIVQFERDSIDESPRLFSELSGRFPGDGRVRTVRLPGTHVTPNTPDAVMDLAAEGDSPYYSSSAATDPEAAAAVARVGDTWIRESGMRDVGQFAAQLARRELQSLASTVINYLNESPQWPIDPAAALPWEPSKQ